MLLQLSLSLVAALLAVSVKSIYKLVLYVVHPFFSPLKNLRSPPSHGFFTGNLKEVLRTNPSLMHEQWVEAYGPVFKYKVEMGADRLFVLDVRAVTHIINYSNDYQKPEFTRLAISRLFGEGILMAEGEVHKKQRRVMSPAFGIPHLREQTSIFLGKAIQLRDMWTKQVRQSEGLRATIEVVSSLNKVTLDIIGLAGFGYDFESLNGDDKPNELNEALRAVFGGRNSLGTIDLLHNILPFTRVIPTKRSAAIRNARNVMDRIGYDLVKNMKADVHASKGGPGNDQIGRKDFKNKDILSLLVRANMASDLPKNSRLSDEELLAQIPTLIIAGHETTSASLTLILNMLATHPEVQNKLREELLLCDQGEHPSMDVLNNLSYLDAVIRETLRLHTPVTSTVRVATKDDIIPTDCEWEDRNGVRRKGIPVSAGDSIFVPLYALNRSKAIWGKDAHEPERWSSVPEAASSLPGIWKNSFTFWGGQRACIGYRFSLVETKAIMYTLIRSFRFEMAIDPENMELRSPGIVRPYIKGKKEEGAQLPLAVTAV
ncbi:cytochrome P450 [Vararia minispora EC-137]|uniref:Cytochrome P450 n=1 Tax=Vararia minispora EC-137 TaxID=1314806 RepID=A0ACB8R0E7_9AGAM|nr:cytochrome P450 [Vararia minispora EC-137]